MAPFASLSGGVPDEPSGSQERPNEPEDEAREGILSSPARCSQGPYASFRPMYRAGRRPRASKVSRWTRLFRRREG